MSSNPTYHFIYKEITMFKLLFRLGLALALILGASAFTTASVSANWTPPEYLWIGGRAASSFSVGVQDATLKFCADNLYQNTVWVEMYRNGRVWKYKIAPYATSSSNIIVSQMWNSNDINDRVAPVGNGINIPKPGLQRYISSNSGATCYQISNLDGAGDTLPGVTYSTIVWYEHHDAKGAILGGTSNPYFEATWMPTGCYGKPGDNGRNLNGTHLCDSGSR
jgi:hypothetical protein